MIICREEPVAANGGAPVGGWIDVNCLSPTGPDLTYAQLIPLLCGKP